MKKVFNTNDKSWERKNEEETWGIQMRLLPEALPN